MTLTAPEPTATADAGRRRVAVVTGASRGLGRGIATALAASGCDLVLHCSTDPEALAATAADVGAAGGRSVPVAGDVTDPAVADDLVDAALDAFDGLDVWVNNAGVSSVAPVVDTAPEEVERMVSVNLLGTFHGLRAAARHLRAAGRPGRIVNVASELGVAVAAHLGVYAATKFAVVGLTRAAAVELAPLGITVNAVGPGTAETDMVLAEWRAEAALTGRSTDEVRAELLATIPAGRFCDPADAGALVAWVAGPDAAYVTGQTLLVNGGAVLH